MSVTKKNVHDTAKQFDVRGLDSTELTNQQDAFEACLEFLEGIEPTQALNRRHTSYGLKHVVENPAGRMEVPSDPDAYKLYVYEGTLILAALASGFHMKQIGDGLSAIFNFSERSLKRRAKEIAEARVKEKST
jgi:hypothetical protein